MIPDAAIEASGQAWKAVNATPGSWTLEGNMRKVLEAAAPHMLAEAKAQALEEAAAEVDEGVPAYGQEEYADWLRARAATYRPAP